MLPVASFVVLSLICWLYRQSSLWPGGRYCLMSSPAVSPPLLCLCMLCLCLLCLPPAMFPSAVSVAALLAELMPTLAFLHSQVPPVAVVSMPPTDKSQIPQPYMFQKQL